MYRRYFSSLEPTHNIQLVLVVLDLNKEIRVEANASEYTTGGVLLIRYEDDK